MVFFWQEEDNSHLLYVESPFSPPPHVLNDALLYPPPER